MRALCLGSQGEPEGVQEERTEADAERAHGRVRLIQGTVQRPGRLPRGLVRAPAEDVVPEGVQAEGDEGPAALHAGVQAAGGREVRAS